MTPEAVTKIVNHVSVAEDALGQVVMLKERLAWLEAGKELRVTLLVSSKESISGGNKVELNLSADLLNDLRFKIETEYRLELNGLDAKFKEMELLPQELRT